MVRVDEREFVLADLPGLIEGAHEGTGLGDRFLGHTERCNVLLHLVDGTIEDPGEAYRVVRGELESYGHGLTDKPEIVALSKADALTPEAIKTQTAKLKKAAKKTPLVLSRASGQGVPEALRALAQGDRRSARARRAIRKQKKRPGSRSLSPVIPGAADGREPHPRPLRCGIWIPGRSLSLASRNGIAGMHC